MSSSAGGLPRQGDVFELDLPLAGFHRCVIVSTGNVNRGSNLIVVPFTSARLTERKNSATSAYFAKDSYAFVDRDCVAHCEALEQVAIDDRDRNIGELTSEDLDRVMEKLANVFGLIHVPEA